ncbi:hypothetical protein TWF481_011493 [Arthrobotrys musiformis]|uniref:Uncharacterized protein n=1 Tax=Arthrobotrys musiformis TaxID=47236 RepID=A0AAV9VYL6_9PEZI
MHLSIYSYRLLLLQLLGTYRVYGQTTSFVTSFTTEVIVTTETIFSTVTVGCNGLPVSTALATSNDATSTTLSTGIATETVTVAVGTLTETQTIHSTTTGTTSVTTTVSGSATDIAISAGVPFALNIFGPGDVSLAAVVDSTGAVELVDASTVSGDATAVYIDDVGFIRLLDSQDDVLYFPGLTFPKLFQRQTTTGKAAAKAESELSTSDTAGNFSASASSIVLEHEGTGVGFFFNNPASGRRGFYGVPSGQTPDSTLTSGTVKGSVVSTSVSATKGVSTTANSTTATGIDAIITSYSSFCQAYLSLSATATEGSTTTVASTTLISTNFSNTTVSSPGPLESTQTKTPEVTVATVGTFETWSSVPSGQRLQGRQTTGYTDSTTSTTSTSTSTASTSTASTASTSTASDSTASNSTASAKSTNSTLSIPEALQTYSSDVISSACKARVTYSLISTSIFYISEGTETTTTDVGETSTIYGPSSSTITETANGTTVPVTATIVAQTLVQPTPSAICRIGTGSNICLDIVYNQTATNSSSLDPIRAWAVETSRDLIAEIPLFTLDEYGRLTYTHPSTQTKLYAALPKGNPTEANPLTFISPQYKSTYSFGYVKWFWDPTNNDKLILDPDNGEITNSGDTAPTGLGVCFYNSPAPSPAPQGSYFAIGPASATVYDISTQVVNCFMGLSYGFRA